MTDVLLDQGVTRLQLLAFLRGEDDPSWNGGEHKWLRYRMHSIRRYDTLDGLSILLTYTEHDGAARDATWTVRLDLPDVDYNAAAVLRNIDTIIDAAIAHHGPGSVA